MRERETKENERRLNRRLDDQKRPHGGGIAAVVGYDGDDDVDDDDDYVDDDDSGGCDSGSLWWWWMVVVGGGWLKVKRERRVWCSVCVVCVFRRGFVVEEKKNKPSSPCRLQTFGPPLLLQCRCGPKTEDLFLQKKQTPP
ncbi:hypothetical protein HanRHA438_Chr10g0468311 [Helianthus annuus]|nr:hypothetical protein HanIR_Chr10g0490991 [Helianthus annuus]KAJ0880894.1 hypothetical protein HanRHA438_Chr10g0468311 [Helianthus annuus]